MTRGGGKFLIYQLIRGVKKTVVAQFENKLQPLSPELCGLVDGGRVWGCILVGEIRLTQSWLRQKQMEDARGGHVA